MGNWIFIVLGIVFLVIPVIIGIYNLIKTSFSVRITFVKKDKKLTVLSGHLSDEDIKELVNF